MASNSKRSRDDKTKFTEAEKNWNLEKLYEDLRAAKQRGGSGKRKVLTEIEKCHLRGLLCGCSDKEIASERGVVVGTVNDALSKTLYCYIEELLDYKKKIRHWGDVSDFLEKAGYKIQVSEQFQPSHPLADKVVQDLKKYLALPECFNKLRRSIFKYPECLPIETYMFSAYKFRTNVRLPEGGTVDCIAARPDTGGIKGYIYYFGSPYESPFTESGKPQRELASLLELAHKHASIAIRPLSSRHVLHPERVIGSKSAGMKQWYFNLREEKGFGPYGSLNIYLIIGQRTHHYPMHDINQSNSITAWREKFAKYNTSIIQGCDVRLDILSYSRLMQPFM